MIPMALRIKALELKWPLLINSILIELFFLVIHEVNKDLIVGIIFKTAIILAVLAALAACGSSSNETASDDIPVIEIESLGFTDPNLENCVDTYAIANDLRYVSEMTELSCFGYGILDTTGIEQLTSLRTLDLIDNNFTSISLDGLAELTSVYLIYNPLDTETILYIEEVLKPDNIEVDYSTEIEQLEFASSDLENCVDNYAMERSWLFISDMTSLVCTDQFITDTGGIEQLNELMELNISDSRLEYVNLGALNKLLVLDLSGNSLTEIDLSSQSQLTSMNLEGNQLSSIDLSQKINITDIYLSENNLETVTFGSHAQLKQLDLSQNELRNVDLASLPQLTLLNLSRNKVKEIDVRNQTKLEILDLTFNPLLRETVSYLENKVENMIYSSIFDLSFKDNEMEACVQAVAMKSGAELSTELTELDCSDYVLYSATGIEQLPLLTSLILLGNNLYTDIMDISELQELTELDLSSSRLLSLDLSAQTKLTSLSLSNNDLSSVDLRNQTQLIQLQIPNNRLTDIILPNPSQIENLDLSNNNLSSIDLSEQVNLTTLDLGGNEISSIELSSSFLTDLNLYNNILESVDVSNLTLLTQLNLAFNQIINVDLTNLTELSSLELYGNPLSGATISYIENVLIPSGMTVNIAPTIRELNFTDEKMKVCVDSNANGNNWIFVTDMTSLSCTLSNSVSNASGIEQLTELESISFRLTSITDIDLSVLNKLTYASLWGNNLSEIQLPNLSILTFLDLRSNELMDIDFSAQDQLDELAISQNPLSSETLQYINEVLRPSGVIVR